MEREDEVTIEYIAALVLLAVGRQKNLVDGSLEPYTIAEAVATVQAVKEATYAKHPRGRK